MASCEHSNDPLGYVTWGISEVAEWLLVSQKAVSSMALVIKCILLTCIACVHRNIENFLMLIIVPDCSCTFSAFTVLCA
jgi:hypothetical protein